jgi:class 3 adenylate cyclase
VGIFWPPQQIGDMKNSRILLIEDESHYIQAVSAILNEHGYQTSVATDGQKGLDLLDRFRPDLILLDIMMPGLDGYEVCRRIKASRAWRDIPVIFLTGMTDPLDIVNGFEAGAVDYVPKPFNAPELLARVRTHLELDALYRENQRLLLNVLPGAIADRIKNQQGVIAESFEDVSVLFADIVGFTSLSSRMKPAEVLELMNRVFSCFDELADRHGLEKIKTIGDAYMAAGGLPVPRDNHLNSAAEMSLDMLEKVREIPCDHGPIRLRIGLHSGAAIGGVIGVRKFVYDIWGEAVNMASRLESSGEPGRIHVSKAVALRLNDRFRFESRGTVAFKGQQPVETFYLVSRL